MKNNRFVYFIYFITKTNRKKFWRDIRYVHHNTKHSIIYLLFDIISSSLRKGISFHEYFYYRFHSINSADRNAYASAAYMYEYQLFHNPHQFRYLLEDKLTFLREYKEYVGRNWLAIRETSLDQLASFLENKSKVVLKNSRGGAGKSVSIVSLTEFNAITLLEYAIQNNFDLLEEFVYQHKELMALSPNSLNTVRVITQVDRHNRVDIIGTILRMGIDRNNDNLSTGGIACSIDPLTGIINGPGISFDITKSDYFVHPVSGQKLIGFTIPFWKEVINMCEAAALLHTENRSIGWDVAIKDEGPLLIEGNHDWGARLWQMPVKKGLKHLVIKYMP